MNDTHGDALDETIRRRFESAWRNGAPQSIEDLLPDHEAPHRLATLEELVHIELEFVWKRFAARDKSREEFPEPPSVESYLKRFPQLNAAEVVQRLRDQATYVRRHYGAAAQPLSERRSSPIADVRSVDRYQLLEECGRGGFGVVWRARDPKFGRDVALKELAACHVPQEQQQRFVNEAIIEARLEHPGVVPVYDLGDLSSERPFYTMKLVQGRTLAEAIREFHEQPRARRTRSVEQLNLLQAFLSVTRTMEFAHSRGVLHRDLKPQNIILGEFGETVILDWGLAKDRARPNDVSTDDSALAVPTSTPVATLPGTVQGTPAYMSPEQALGKVREVDLRSDIYALGVVLFEILTGKLPFTADSSESMLMLVAEANPARPRVFDADIPPALEAICIKAMQKSPDARYGNARELREDIERFLADAPVLAHRETILQRLARSARRHKSLVLGTAAVLSVAALAAGLFAAAQTVKNRQLNALNAQLERANKLERKARDAVSELADLNRDFAVSARRQAAQVYQRQGLRLLKDGESIAGLHSLLRSLELAPAGSEAIQRVGLENLAIWSEHFLPPVAQRRVPRLLENDLYVENSPLILRLAPLQADLTLKSKRVDGLWGFLNVLDQFDVKAILQPINETDLSSLGAGIQPTGEWLDFYLDASTQMLQIADLEGEWIWGTVLLKDPASVDRELRELMSAVDLTEFDHVLKGTLHVRQLSLVTGQLGDRDLRISGCFVRRSTPQGQRLRNLKLDSTGKTYLYCDYASRAISVWSLEKGGQVGKTLPGTAGDVSDDGRVVAVLQSPTTVQLYSVTDQRPVGGPLKHDANVRLLELSPSGSVVASVTDGKAVYVWDAKNPKVSTRLDCQLATVDFLEIPTQNDALMIADSQKGAELWMLRHRGGRLEGLKVKESGANSPLSRQPYWTREGRWCIVHLDRGFSEQLEVWSPSVDPDRVVVASHASGSGRIEYHEKSDLIVCGANNAIQVTKRGADWSLTVGESIRDFRLSPDGNRLAVIDKVGVVRVWDLLTRRLMGETLEEPPGVHRILFGFRRSNQTIFAAELPSLGQISEANLVQWAIPEKSIETIPFPQYDTVRQRLLTVPGTDIVAFQQDADPPPMPRAADGKPGPIMFRDWAMAFSRDGATLAIGGSDGKVSLRSRVTGALVGDSFTISEPTTDNWGPSELMFSPDGKTLLAVHQEDSERELPFRAQWWDLTARHPLGPAVTVENANRIVAWNASVRTMVVGVIPPLDSSGEIAAALYGKDVGFRIWDLSTGRPVGSPLVHGDEITAAEFSPDGRILATCSFDQTARLWDAATGRPLCGPLRHYDAVAHVFFVNQGSVLLTVTNGGSWRTWSVETGEPLLPSVSPPHRREVVAAVSADGWRLVTAGATELVQAQDVADEPLTGAFRGEIEYIQEWDVATGLPLGPPRMVHGKVRSVVFTGLSQSVAAIVGNDLCIWPRTELQKTDLATLASWVRSLTGVEFDALDALRPLTGSEIEENRKRLAERGGVSRTTAKNVEVWRVKPPKEAKPMDWPPRIEVKQQKQAEVPSAPNGFPAPIPDPDA